MVVASLTKRVVLVDDDAGFRGLLRTAMELDGRFAVVGEGATGIDALALLNGADVDLVVLDFDMPMMDGLTACREIARLRPEVGVVLLTGSILSADQRLAVDQLVGQLVSKDRFDVVAFLDVLRDL